MSVFYLEKYDYFYGCWSSIRWIVWWISKSPRPAAVSISYSACKWSCGLVVKSFCWFPNLTHLSTLYSIFIHYNELIMQFIIKPHVHSKICFKLYWLISHVMLFEDKLYLYLPYLLRLHVMCNRWLVFGGRGYVHCARANVWYILYMCVLKRSIACCYGW